MIFNYRFAGYSFPPSARALYLAGADLAERLRPLKLRLIVAQGDPSIDLAVLLRNSYFSDIPIISFEATDRARTKYRDQASLYQYNSHDYTAEILQLGLLLFPKATHIVTLVSVGSDEKTYSALIDELRAAHPGLGIVPVLNPTWSSVDEALRVSPKDSFVILLSPGWVSAEGLLLGPDLIDSIDKHYGLPVLSYLQEFAGSGLVGGVGVAARNYGRAVADLGLSVVLDGKKPEPWFASNGLSDELRGLPGSPSLRRIAEIGTEGRGAYQPAGFLLGPLPLPHRVGNRPARTYPIGPRVLPSPADQGAKASRRGECNIGAQGRRPDG